MRRLQWTLILVLCAGQVTAVAVPFTYCLEDGKFCCVGWASEFCGDEEAGPGPELTASPSCANVRVAFCGIQAGPRSSLPHPDVSPALGNASLGLRAPAPAVARPLWEPVFRRPFDPTSLLDSVILLL